MEDRADHWIFYPGSWIQDPGSRILDLGSWIQDPASGMLRPGFCSQDPGAGSRTTDPGSRILDPHTISQHLTKKRKLTVLKVGARKNASKYVHRGAFGSIFDHCNCVLE